MVKKKKVVEKEVKADVAAREQGEAEFVSPDVCETPPPSEAGPIPVPYPNTAMASETSYGAKKVKVEGKETAVEKSPVEASSGDEAGTTKGSLSIVIKVVKDHPLWVAGSLIVLFVVVWVLLSNAPSTLEPVEEGSIQEVISLLNL